MYVFITYPLDKRNEDFCVNKSNLNFNPSFFMRFLTVFLLFKKDF